MKKTNPRSVDTEVLTAMIDKGKRVLQSHNPSIGDAIRYQTLDRDSYASWRAQVINYLQLSLTAESIYYGAFYNQVQSGAHVSNVTRGIELLKTILEDANAGLFDTRTNEFEALSPLENLFNVFHIVTRQLRSRHDNRETLNVKDEYDVQDLLHTLLTIHFDDIRPEEWTPSYAGKASRMDFLLHKHGIVIEVKKTRPSLTGKEVGDELIIDIERYSHHANCTRLLCFVYDPEGFISNPRGFETDLNRERDGLEVAVYVRPRF